MSDPRVAALGGGHGLAASLAALKLVTERVTAVVTVADDGGSSGRLRDELGVLPPGDLRMALAALCDDSTWGHTWRDVLQHRFAGEGALAGHALGNLLIVSLWDLLGDTVVVLTRGGYTQVEHTLTELGHGEAVIEQRRVFKLAMTERFRAVVGEATGREVVAVLSATHVAPDIGCETFVLAPAAPATPQA